MSPVIPAIIPTSLSHLKETFQKVAPFAREVQVDVVDGVFVPFISWPYGGGEAVPELAQFTGDFIVEVDLMLMNPEEVIREYIDAKARQIVVHLESTKKLEDIIAIRKEHDFKLGFSINNDTPLGVLTRVIHDADYVQLMGIAHIGSQGQAFDERVLERIIELKRMYPSLLISIDGSVNQTTISKLAHAGADRCVSGSAILKQENSHEAYDALVALYTIGVQ
jgi:ribulose-phosphate 3-epimerase